MSTVDDEAYFVWVDEITAYGDQFQASSSARHMLEWIGVDQIILWLCGGCASGLLTRYGEVLADLTIAQLKKVARHRPTADNGQPVPVRVEAERPSTATAAEAAESVTIVINVAATLNVREELRVSFGNDLVVLGLDHAKAETVAAKIAEVPSRSQ
jgi:hypothetical protein